MCNWVVYRIYRLPYQIYCYFCYPIKADDSLTAMRFIVLFCFSYLFFSNGHHAWAQRDNQYALMPKGHFLSDTIQVGEPVKYAFSLRHQATTQVVLPDSAYDYSPFYFIEKRYFPTRTDSLGSTDSVVYTLATFELDSLPSLALPVYAILPSGDSLERWSLADTLLLLSNDSIQPNYLADTTLRPIDPQFNYLYWSIGIMVIIVLLLLINGFLGKPVNRAFKLLIMYQRHQTFIKLFDRLARQLEGELSANELEKILTIWKKYIEKVDNIPYSTYTTREITQLLPDDDLKITLQAIDRFVYGGIRPEGVKTHIDLLRTQAATIYQAKTATVRKQ